MSGPFGELPRGYYGAILVDPPVRFVAWSGKGIARAAENHYPTMTHEEIRALPVASLAAEHCVLLMWICWPHLKESLLTMEAWGFEFKTCGFAWTKAHAGQLEMFRDDIQPQVGLGYWTRANTEPCLLGTRGRPQRLNADVRQAIIAPRREHSRKPDEIYARIERLVGGPYLELFARQRRPGWDCWGNETDKFSSSKYDAAADVEGSFNEAYHTIRARIAAGGPGWIPK